MEYLNKVDVCQIESARQRRSDTECESVLADTTNLQYARIIHVRMLCRAFNMYVKNAFFLSLSLLRWVEFSLKKVRAVSFTLSLSIRHDFNF